MMFQDHLQENIVFNLLQICQLTRISQGVEVDNDIFCMLLEPIMYQVGPDKSGTAGNQDDHASKRCGEKLPAESALIPIEIQSGQAL